MTAPSAIMDANMCLFVESEGVNPQEERRRCDPATPPVISCDISSRQENGECFLLGIHALCCFLYSRLRRSNQRNYNSVSRVPVSWLRQSVSTWQACVHGPSWLFPPRPGTGYRCGRLFLKNMGNIWRRYGAAQQALVARFEIVFYTGWPCKYVQSPL